MIKFNNDPRYYPYYCPVDPSIKKPVCYFCKKEFDDLNIKQSSPKAYIYYAPKCSNNHYEVEYLIFDYGNEKIDYYNMAIHLNDKISFSSSKNIGEYISICEIPHPYNINQIKMIKCNPNWLHLTPDEIINKMKKWILFS